MLLDLRSLKERFRGAGVQLWLVVHDIKETQRKWQPSAVSQALLFPKDFRAEAPERGAIAV
jgi:hypothetical protein